MTSTDSPAKLSDQHLADFKTAFTRVSPGNWQGLRDRAEAASRLAERAFGREERAAWEVIQVLQYLLQYRGQLRPTEPGDVLVLDTLYRAEEAATPISSEAPVSSSIDEFLRALIARLESYSIDKESERWIDERARADYEYICYQFVPGVKNFVGVVALASFGLPRPDAAMVYENLWDEVAHGDEAQYHYAQFQQMAGQFGTRFDDESVFAWALPEAFDIVNAQLRTLWRGQPAASLASLYLFERLDLMGYVAFSRSLRGLGAQREFIDAHLVIDVEHAAKWVERLGQHVRSPEGQRAAYGAAVDRAQRMRRLRMKTQEGLARWKATGTPPRAPFRELLATVG